MYASTCMHVCILHMYACDQMKLWKLVYVYAHTHVHTYIHKYIHTLETEKQLNKVSFFTGSALYGDLFPPQTSTRVLPCCVTHTCGAKCMYMCVCMYACMYVTNVDKSLAVLCHTHLWSKMYVCMCVCMYVCVCVCMSQTSTRVLPCCFTQTYGAKCMYAFVYTCVCMSQTSTRVLLCCVTQTCGAKRCMHVCMCVCVCHEREQESCRFASPIPMEPYVCMYVCMYVCACVCVSAMCLYVYKHSMRYL
jgi:hypothetical protein